MNAENTYKNEFKSRDDWVGKVIHWELCKILEFNHTTKLYMHKLESILENETHKILWDFEIQTDHQIPAGRPDLVLTRKKELVICWILLFQRTTKWKWKQKRTNWQILGSCQRTKKNLWKMRMTVIRIVVGALGTVLRGAEKRQTELEIRRRIKTIRTTSLLRSARILRRVLETWGDLPSLRFQ